MRAGDEDRRRKDGVPGDVPFPTRVQMARGYERFWNCGKNAAHGASTGLA